MKLNGECLCGYTESEIYMKMIYDKACPLKVDSHFTYMDCKEHPLGHNCLTCWRTNLLEEYEVNK